MENYFDRITIDPDKLGGKPCLRGYRISVETILGHLASGDKENEILDAYPFLESEDIRAALMYASYISGHHQSTIPIHA